MSRSKRHHFVPQALQRQFADERGKLWYAERGENGLFRPAEYRSPTGSFWKRNYYTLLGADGPTDVVEREHYGKIDDYIGRLVPHISRVIDDGMIPLFTGDALTSLRIVVLHMMRRTPDFFRGFNDFALGLKFIEKYEKHLQAADNSYLLKEFRQEMLSEQRVREQGRDVRVRATISPMPAIEGAMEEFFPKFVLSRTRHSFVLSSAMIYRRGSAGDPNLEIWMPIAPKVAILFRREKLRDPVIVEIASASQIREVNECATKCEALASHSHELIASLTGEWRQKR